MPVLCLWNLSYIIWAALSVNLRLRWNLKAFAFDLCGISDLFKSAWRSTRAPTFSFLGWIRCHVSEINSKIGSRFSSFRPETQKALGGENFCTLPYGGVSNSMKLCWNECRDSVWYTVWASGWIVHRLHRIHVSYILKGIFFFFLFFSCFEDVSNTGNRKLSILHCLGLFRSQGWKIIPKWKSR